MREKIEKILIDPKSLNQALCCSWEQIDLLVSLFDQELKEVVKKAKPDANRFGLKDKFVSLVQAGIDQYEENILARWEKNLK